jgi:hypothetical protein
MRISPDFKQANFFDICDGTGRILHKLEMNDSLEYDLSFLNSGRYTLWTVCEGCARQFHFAIS